MVDFTRSRYYREGVRLATQKRVDDGDPDLVIRDVSAVDWGSAPAILVAQCPACGEDIVFMKTATELRCACGFHGTATIKRRVK